MSGLKLSPEVQEQLFRVDRHLWLKETQVCLENMQQLFIVFVTPPFFATRMRATHPPQDARKYYEKTLNPTPAPAGEPSVPKVVTQQSLCFMLSIPALNHRNQF